MKKHIVLIGFMGCGKSSVGRQLARELKIPYLDMDQKIEARAGMKINHIFEKYGEKYFRDMETDLLRELKDTDQPMVISAGGGVAAQKQNIPILKEAGKVILLEASVETLMQRLSRDTTRPMLKGGNLQEKIEGLMEKRKDAYLTASEYRVNTDQKSIQEIVREIKDKCDL